MSKASIILLTRYLLIYFYLNTFTWQLKIFISLEWREELILVTIVTFVITVVVFVESLHGKNLRVHLDGVLVSGEMQQVLHGGAPSLPGAGAAFPAVVGRPPAAVPVTGHDVWQTWGWEGISGGYGLHESNSHVSSQINKKKYYCQLKKIVRSKVLGVSF